MDVQCSENVRTPGVWPRYHQCERKAVVLTGTEGWCKIHSPEAKAARAAAATERYNHKMAEVMAPHVRAAALAAEVTRLRALNARLVEALRVVRLAANPDGCQLCEGQHDRHYGDCPLVAVDAALAAAREEAQL